MSLLVAHVRNTIKPEAYWESIFPGIKWSGGDEGRAISPLRTDDKNTPSLSVNRNTGAWYDHGTSDGGKSIVSFHARLNNIEPEQAAADLFESFIHPVIDMKRVRAWARKLKLTPSFYDYLTHERFLAPAVIEQMYIGTNGDRITIPIKNEFNMVVNVKYYDPNASKIKGGPPKMLNHTDKTEPRSFGVPTMVYPLGVLIHLSPSDPVILCEGEWDALLLYSMGFSAVTMTHGSKSWADQYTELFRGREVIIAYDNDRGGEEGTVNAVKKLSQVASLVKRLVVPKEYGKDITDWCRNFPPVRKSSIMKAVIARSTELLTNPTSFVVNTRVHAVPLDEASKAQYHNQPITVNALVTGKDVAPFILPKKVRVTCSKKCDECPLAESGKEFRECEIDSNKPDILGLVDVSESKVKRTVITMAGMPMNPKCRHQIQSLESFNVESVILIPTLDDSSSGYVTRPAYFTGHGLKPNRAYTLIGTTAPHPDTQQAVHLFTHAKPVQSEVEGFEITPTIVHSLAKFRPKPIGPMTAKAVIHKLNELADWQSRNITRIIGRPDLHIAVDLVFHSVAGFTVNNESVNRGMLDVLILGDTRCGKGYVAEGLAKYYKLGEVASGENCSFAGLVGGCEAINKRFIVKWGIIPLNNGRLVVIDEASSLSETDFSKLSRVRSEGTAEINKIVREVTQASARLLWLANPRSGRPISTYNAGVMAIRELVGASEDVSRFDFALTVATNEVNATDINKLRASEVQTDSNKYSHEDCRNLVMWAWSREPNQVYFEDDAVTLILDLALEMGRIYNPQIPLVQSENIRVKLAKVSAAVAARVFSCDETGKKLIVTKSHVEAAHWFITSCYNKKSMAYDSWSAAMFERNQIADEAAVIKLFEDLNTNKVRVMKSLANLHQITADNLADYMGGDILTAKTVLGDLVQLGCLTRHERGNWYLKNQAFIEWLRVNNPSFTLET